MDNLIAEGRALPMLVVMERGYASRPGEPDPRWQRGSENLFGRVLLDDLVPMIDGAYRSIADRDHRALAGLSMGAGQAMRIGLANLDVFGSIGALSGGGREFDPKTSFGGVFADANEANEKLDLLWIGCGREDGLFGHAKSLHEALSRHGVEHVWFECDGDHEWHVWRRHLYELAPLLFRG